MVEYEMTRKQVYNLMGVNPKLPRKKDGQDGLKTYYSKKHIDTSLKPSEDLSLYYTTYEVTEKYHNELRRLYKVAKRIGFKSHSRSGRIWYFKDDVDALIQQ